MELNNKIQLCIIQNGKIALLEKRDMLYLPSGMFRKGENKIVAASRIAMNLIGVKVRILPISFMKKENGGRVLTVLGYPVSDKVSTKKYNIIWNNMNSIDCLSDGAKKDINRMKQCIYRSETIKRAGLLVYKKQKDKIKFLFISSLMNSNRFIIPQGHVEDGESFEDAAIRETEEEAGISAEIKEKLGFFFLERGKNIYQTHIYLAKFKDNVCSDENRIIKWLSYEEVIKKDILRETKIFLKDIYCNKKRRKLLK